MVGLVLGVKGPGVHPGLNCYCRLCFVLKVAGGRGREREKMTFLFREYPSGYLGTVDAYDYVISCDLIDTVVILLMSTLATAPPKSIST